LNSGPLAAKLRGYLTVSASSHRSCYPPDFKEVEDLKAPGKEPTARWVFCFLLIRLRSIGGSDQDHLLLRKKLASPHLDTSLITLQQQHIEAD